MDNEIKLCPFCKGKLTYFGKDLNRRVTPPVIVDVYKHFYADENDTSKDCCLSQLIFDAKIWNTRPIEDALKAENEKLRAALQKIIFSEQRANGNYESHVEGVARKALTDITKNNPVISELRGNIADSEITGAKDDILRDKP